MDLATFIVKGECECLNQLDDHTLADCLGSDLGSDDKYLESECDEQLIISLAFRQPVKIHSLKFKGPADKGPKNIKLFINQPRTIDFDMADSNTSVQDLTYISQFKKKMKIPLKYQFINFLIFFVLFSIGLRPKTWRMEIPCHFVTSSFRTL